MLEQVAAAGATLAVPVVVQLGRMLRRIDQRTQRVDDELQHHRRTLYGDPKDNADNGLVGQVTENSAQISSITTGSPPVSTSKMDN